MHRTYAAPSKARRSSGQLNRAVAGSVGGGWRIGERWCFGTGTGIAVSVGVSGLGLESLSSEN
jgi:hypothetical protein